MRTIEQNKRKLQARKATNARLMKWSTEQRQFLHHEKCNFTKSFLKNCNCNHALDNNLV